jgi:outer membrane receptor for ferrienterochelin and colicin
MKTTLGVSLLALAFVTGAYSQAVAGFGGITGTVTEGSSGDGLPEVTLILSNQSLGFQRTFTASDDGIFDMPALVPASGYSLKASRKGFASREIKDIQVLVGQTLNLIVPMQLESISTKIEDFHPPQVEDTKNVASIVATPEQFDSLPSPGRVLSQFVLLAPAVTQDRSSGIVGFRGEEVTNSVLTDGNDTTNSFHYRQPGIAPQVSEDAVLEMQMLSAAWPAEIGHAMGGVVNAVTRSGTNTLHGDAYDFFAERGWTATDGHAPGFQDGVRQQQAGASLGGPILPGKVFGFLNFEALNNNSQGLDRITNPLIATAAGTSVLASNCKAAAAQCTAAIDFLNPQMNVTVPRSLVSRTGLAKFDYRPNQANSFTFEGDAMHRNAPNGILNAVLTPDSGPGYNGSYDAETRYAKAGYTRTITADTINEARVGWYKDRFSEYADSSLLPSTGLLAINIAGTPVGANPAYPSVLSEQRYQFVDNFTLTAGSNSLKLGVDYSRNQDWMYQPANYHGTYDYSSLTAFAEDFSGNTKILKNYSDFSQSFGNPLTDLKPRIWSAYAQDTWKVSLRFTVTAGVRWEKTLVPQPATANATYYQTGSIGSPNTNFSPRIGFAYKADDRTVLRVGLGTYYQPFPGELMRLLNTWNGVYQANITVDPLRSGSLVYPAIFGPTATLPTGMQDLAFAASKFRNPYSEQGSVEIERELAKGTTLTVGYIDSRGNKLWTQADQSLVSTTTTNKTYTIDNASGAQVNTYTTQIFTNRTTYAHPYQIENEGESRYKAVNVQLRAQLPGGLTFRTAYTWSHTIDDVSGAPALGFIPSNTAPGDFASDRGDSSLDQRQRAVVSWTWQPRLAPGQSPAARFLVNGWQLSSIATLASGLPQTATVAVNGQQFTGLTMAYTTSMNGSDGWQRVPFEPVNSLRMGPEYNVDLRITRILPFTERIKGMLMFEAFNAFNTQYDTSLNTIAFTATSGVLKPVAGVGTGTSSYDPVYGTNARRAQVAFKLVF